VTNTGQSPSGNGGDPLSGAAMFTFDADKRIHSWNEAAERLTGLTADEVVGRPCWDVLCAHDEDGGVVCHAGCSFHRSRSNRHS
jgi:PAS domain S-box-containing protein